MEQPIIYCDDCKFEFSPNEVEFKRTKTTIEDESFEVVYYKCPGCGKVYVVCLLNYWATKLQNKYVGALDTYRASINKGLSELRLRQKADELQRRKDEAMAYQHELLSKYGNLLPEEIFE